MKKTLAILLTLVLLLGVVGCATETTVEEPDVTPEATPVATDGGEESTEGGFRYLYRHCLGHAGPRYGGDDRGKRNHHQRDRH